VEIDPHRLAALMAGGAPHAVLDVRERGRYERGHIFRSTSLPRRLLEFRLPVLVTAPGTPVVLVDDDGRLAGRAARTAAAMGYRDVRVLGGGLAAWRAAGYPLVEGLNVPSKVLGEQVLRAAGTPRITAPALAARLAAGEDLIVLDARTPEEYRRGTVPGAVNVPGGELVWRIGDLAPRPATTIVVHCGGRTRSFVGAESLRRMGLPNLVLVLDNGTMGWALAGLPLERDADRRAPEPSARARALAAAAAERIAAEDGVRPLGPDALRRLWERRGEDNVQILDVRTAEEYAAGHVAGARWAPGGQLVQATDDYVAVWAAHVVLVCDGFVRATLAASWLRRLGLPNVAVLAGGLPAWRAAGGAVEVGHAEPEPFGLEAARARVGRVVPGPLGDALVVSVDPSDAYRRGHVPGAVWLNRGRLEDRIAAVAPDRHRPIVLTCADGRQSTLAAATLADLGYTAVRVLAGGTAAWRAAGLPLEAGPGRLADEPDDVVPKPYERGPAAMRAYLAWEEALDDQGRSPHPLFVAEDSMATTETYTLDQFIADLDRITAAESSPEAITGRVAPLLARLVRTPDAVPAEYRRRGPDGRRGRWMLHRAPRFNVTAVVWGPGDVAGAHDHGTWGVIGVVDNEIEETRYRVTPAGPGRARLEVTRVMRHGPGAVSCLVPDDEVHRMYNPTARDTVEIHVYGRDLAGLPRRTWAEDGTEKPLVSPKYLNC
jgi:rhodanese-related sulfurtransferase/predicted metal-dependent enzyme (double-stranded beta helix superfamily)